MAFNYPIPTPHPKHKEVDHLDRISCNCDLVRDIPAARMPMVVLLVTMSDPFSAYGYHAVLYHCEIDRQRRTFMKGEWNDLGLYNEEKECEELRGKAVNQALLSQYGSAYLLTDGELYSMGCNDNSQLGRSTQDVPTTRFAKVDISDHIVSVTCGLGHCLAMTPTKVFAFGWNDGGRAGVSGRRNVTRPTEIYFGIRGQAPLQVAAGRYHSAILAEDGQVFTFGYGYRGALGHGTNTDISNPENVKALRSKVQQIGCTENATYFLLLDGLLLGCGWNDGSRLGVGHGKYVNVPTMIQTGKHKIQSFRCSLTLVVAITLSGEALVWGECSNRVIIEVPKLVQALEFPRDVFARERFGDTGGSVYPYNLQVWMNDMECLTSQLTELKQKMEPLVSQMIKLNLKLLRVYDDESASKLTSARDPEHQAIQLLDHTSLLAEHASLQETYKAIERKHMDMTKKFDMKQKEQESLQVEFQKLSRNYQSKQVEFTSQQAILDDIKKERTKLKGDLQSLETQHRDLKSRVEDSKRTTISMRALMHVADNIGELWSTLVIVLEIPPPKVHNITATCFNIPHRALAVLHEWYSRDPENATKEALINALRDIPCNDIADEILEM